MGYENYRDSNVMWLGSIPAHWEVMRLKPAVVIRSEKAKYHEGAGDKFIGLENLTSYGSELRETSTQYGDAVRAICRKGDILFCRLRPYLAKVIIAPNDSFCTGELLVIKSFVGNMKYLRYVMLAPGFIGKVNSQTQGATMPFASPETVLNMYIPVPPKDEQDQIARFLDWKITAIDKLISIRRGELRNLADLKKALITREVTRGNNTGWTATKLKRICNMRAGKNLTSEQINPDAGDYLVYGGNGIRGYYSDYNIDGDYILIGRQGALCGNVHRVSGKIWATDHAVITKFNNDIDINYAYYLLLNMNLNKYSSDKAAQPGLSISMIKNLPVIIPPTTEQKRIANYLDRICTRIDSAITNFTQQIDTLKELKARLISDTVTGKIDVRNIPVPEQEKIS